MSTCIKKLKAEKSGKAPDYILIDGNRLPDDLSKEEAQFVIKVHISFVAYVSWSNLNLLLDNLGFLYFTEVPYRPFSCMVLPDTIS